MDWVVEGMCPMADDPIQYTIHNSVGLLNTDGCSITGIQTCKQPTIGHVLSNSCNSLKIMISLALSLSYYPKGISIIRDRSILCITIKNNED